jgi:hypothetical protein
MLASVPGLCSAWMRSCEMRAITLQWLVAGG